MRPTLSSYCLLGVTALCLGAAWPAPVRAESLDFELQRPGSERPIPNGYGGFDWVNLYVLDGPGYSIPDSGYRRGVVSGRHVAYNAFGDPGRVTLRQPGTFTFDSAWLTAAWNDDLNVTVEGWRDHERLYTRTVLVSDDAPTLFQFGFNGVDELRFRSFGGRDAGTPGGGDHFVMDDFTFSDAPPPVPEPATVAMLLCGLGVVGAGAKARRTATRTRGPALG